MLAMLVVVREEKLFFSHDSLILNLDETESGSHEWYRALYRMLFIVTPQKPLSRIPFGPPGHHSRSLLFIHPVYAIRDQMSQPGRTAAVAAGMQMPFFGIFDRTRFQPLFVFLAKICIPVKYLFRKINKPVNK